MISLIVETLTAIKASGHTPADLIFIGSEESGHSCTWREYQQLADFEYNSGYGANEIPTDLILVFSDGSTMWRGEYDGAEWWEFSPPFIMPEDLKPIKTLKGTWELANYNEGDE